MISESRQSSGGTGLGLAIVKAIIERHNGTITCNSSSQGSKFEIRFIIERGLRKT